MANQELVEMLKRSVQEFVAWRESNPDATVDLSGADLSNCTFEKCNFSHCDLTGADLRDTNCNYSKFTGAVLRRAKLFGTTLGFCDLDYADFAGAAVSASLIQSSAQDAIFSGADLTASTMSGADLTRAKFDGAILDGVDMTDAKLDEADLMNLVSYEELEIREAHWDRAKMSKELICYAMEMGAVMCIEED